MVQAAAIADVSPLRAQFGAAARYDLSPADAALDGELDQATGRRTTLAEQVLRAETGFYADPKQTYMGSDEETREEKERRERALREFAADVARQTINYNGVSLSFADVTGRMEFDISVNKSMANMARDYVEVKDSEMLRLDAQGNRISAADDPEGKFIVKTRAEREAWEAKQNFNERVFSQEDVTLSPEGKRISTKDQMQLLGFEDAAQSAEIALGDARSGKTKLADVDDQYLKGAADSKTAPAVAPEFQARIDSYAGKGPAEPAPETPEPVARTAEIQFRPAPQPGF